MEIWKDIYFIENGIEWDYRGLYQISNYGNVKSLGNGDSNRSKERILKPFFNGDYLQIDLRKNNKRKTFKIHRLVAHMFIEGYFDGAEVNHKDENAENNHISNLEWCTREYNVNYGTRNKRTGEANKNKPKKNSKLIARYSLDGELIDIKYQYEYTQMGFEQRNVSACCNGKRKTHKGYIFKYHEKDD